MAKESVSLGEWQDLRDKLNKLLIEDQEAILIQAGRQVGVRLDQAVRMALPPPTRKQKQPFKTHKQRAWWWATMRAKALGKSRALPGWEAHYVVKDNIRTLVISGAYKRTGKLVQSLAYRVTGIKTDRGAAVTVEYGTNRAYARYVIDEQDQSFYHKGNWRTLQNIRDAALPELKNDFKRSVVEKIRKAI